VEIHTLLYTVQHSCVSTNLSVMMSSSTTCARARLFPFRSSFCADSLLFARTFDKQLFTSLPWFLRPIFELAKEREGGLSSEGRDIYLFSFKIVLLDYTTARNLTGSVELANNYTVDHSNRSLSMDTSTNLILRKETTR
jgi:hypothetical protein